jgi:hypothetical protein
MLARPHQVALPLLVWAALVITPAYAQEPVVRAVPIPQARAAAPSDAALFSPARGGEPDTTDWQRYFPLEVGNRWQYLVTDENGSHYYGYEVTYDTTIQGRTYHAVRLCQPELCYDGSPFNPYFELRYDTAHAMVVEWAEPVSGPPYEQWWGEAPCALDAPFDSFVECTGPGAEDWSYFVSGGAGYDLVLPPDTVRGVVYKEFDSIPIVMGAVAGFGVVSRQYVKNPPFGYHRLVYTRIGGVEYGTQAFAFLPPVAMESEPERWPALAVRPNPARGRTVVSLALIRAGALRAEVTDLLGRRVLVLDLGAHPSGPLTFTVELTRLPPATYILNVFAGGHAIGARPITVTR